MAITNDLWKQIQKGQYRACISDMVLQELRETRDRISEEIKDMSIDQMKEYFKEKSNPMLSEINKIREQKVKAI